jgi:hypothetical protein
MSGCIKQWAGNIPKLCVTALLSLLIGNCLVLKPAERILSSDEIPNVACATLVSSSHTELNAEASCTETFTFAPAHRLTKGKVKNAFACQYSQDVITAANAKLNSLTKTYFAKWLFSNSLYLLHRVLLI